ncbi:sulfotransferase domain-containing protein [Hyphococcus flavus]|uniref:Sulfotransferase domain-containing protein n=1 Tax=Hyphococcus flavus TaxID=1866326 RepID=A0AAE9ZJW7_9PROT|nr:sulfotransferase domain-containing protein [Hyphococcus flavus]WDI32481.1 sulfotransferase domain-containing protein [Hyphococcus flavus]
MIIGAAKCGTSAIAAQLNQHPDIFIPEEKELHYFDRLFNLTEEQRDANWARYMGHFREAGSAKRRGEATVAYTMLPRIRHVPDEIIKKLGKIPLIYIVRDPLERIVSQYRHRKSDYPETEPFNVWIHSDMALELCIHRSDYELQIAPFREKFCEDNIHICFYEDYKSDYQRELSSMFEFLNVPSNSAQEIQNNKVNVISKNRVPIPELAQESEEFVRSILRDNIRKFLTHYGKPENFWPSMA